MYSHRLLTQSFSASAAMRAGLQGARAIFFTLHFLERLGFVRVVLELLPLLR